jgi:hypothetical protein
MLKIRNELGCKSGLLFGYPKYFPGGFDDTDINFSETEPTIDIKMIDTENLSCNN